MSKLNILTYERLKLEYVDNLISLCNSCHSKTNSDRNYWKERLYNRGRR